MIRPTIKGLLEAGVLTETGSPCKTPIFPVCKPTSDKCHLVHDLRAVNAAVIAEDPVLPNPHTLLSSIPSEIKYYTVIGLCSVLLVYHCMRTQGIYLTLCTKGSNIPVCVCHMLIVRVLQYLMEL